MAERDGASLIEKYGRRFFEDPEHPGEVYYVVHTGVSGPTRACPPSRSAPWARAT